MRKSTLTNDEFKLKASTKHLNKYDYSKTFHPHSNNFVTIICPIHGEFKQKSRVHKI